MTPLTRVRPVPAPAFCPPFFGTLRPWQRLLPADAYEWSSGSPFSRASTGVTVSPRGGGPGARVTRTRLPPPARSAPPRAPRTRLAAEESAPACGNSVEGLFVVLLRRRVCH